MVGNNSKAIKLQFEFENRAGKTCGRETNFDSLSQNVK